MAETMLIQPISRTFNAQSENLHERRRYGYVDTEENSDVATRPRPSLSENLHESRRHGYAVPDTEAETLLIQPIQWTLNALSENLYERRRYGYVDTKENSDATTEPRLSPLENLHKSIRHGYAVPDTEAGITLIQHTPRHTNSQSKNFHERRGDGGCEPDISECFGGTPRPRPTLSEDLHQRNRRGVVAVDSEEYLEVTRGSRSTQSENLHEQRRHGYAERSTDDSLPIKQIQNLFYPMEQFPRFYYIHNQTMDCMSRAKKAGIGGIQTHLMSENVIIEIGILGKFTDSECNLISKRRGKRKNSKDKTVWKARPLVCFLDSKRDDLRLESACHKILVTTNPISDTDKSDDSFIVVGKNKEQIKEVITSCLEEPLHQMLQEWLDVLKDAPLNKITSGFIGEIEAICKQVAFNNRKYTNSSFLSPILCTSSIVPDDVKQYLFGMPGVHSFGIWENSSFKVFVTKIDEKRLQSDLTRMNTSFFNSYSIDIENGKLEDKLSTLMQGDEIQSKISNDDQKVQAGTLGGFVTKADDQNKKYALTCNHLFPKVGEPAYNKDFEEIGSCLYTTKEKSCDFAAIEIEKSISEKCDEIFKNEEGKKTNAREFSEHLTNVGIVHKIGASTKVTKGRILSSEYYDKLLDDNNREHIFLVKGIPENFSEEGDSGSLIFTRSKDAHRTCVDVLGMVYGNKVTVYDDDDDDDDDDHDHDEQNKKETDCSEIHVNERKGHNVDKSEGTNTPPPNDGDETASNIHDDISSCFRIHTALELFKKNQSEDVKFRDNLSLSSPEQSSEDDESNEEIP